LSGKPKIIEQGASPDQNAAGLLQAIPDPLRYDGHVLDPDEVGGIVAGMVPQGSRILDVGCGTGSLAQILSNTCHAEVVGVEPETARAEVAIGRGLEVHVGWLNEELIHRMGSFDLVLLTDVLEHLPNPQAMLLLSREALRPGGALIVSVPNVAHWSVRSYLLRGRFEYQPFGIMDATHLRWFTAASLRSLLFASGFNVVRYRAAAGLDLLDNKYRAPLCWLPTDWRKRFLRVACKRWPTLFGCQHVVKAEMA
jgi:methionine biosynthesis protein MetW